MLASAVYSQKQFTLEGQIKGVSNSFIYLIHSHNYQTRKFTQDSALVNAEGKFQFKGNLPHPLQAYLTIDKNSLSERDPNCAEFFLEPTKISVTLEKDHFKAIQLTGSPVQKEYEELERARMVVKERMKPLQDAYNRFQKTDQKKADSVREKIAGFRDEYNKVDYDFFKTHPSSYITASNMKFHISELPLEELIRYHEGFGPEVQQSSFGREINTEIEKIKGGSPGAIAKIFSAMDINGSKLSLADYKGRKYVLLDFWASWCVPCRAGNPHLKQVYTKYKDAGLEIIGVSDDDGFSEKWKNAVKEDGIEIWKHVLRGLDIKKRNAGAENDEDISEKYGVSSLPTKILIDKNGVIIGRFNSEEDEVLDKKLKEIFGT